MKLPQGFLDELRSRTSLVQVVGRKVTWDMRKSNQAKGDFWAPCPFHQEKTASFHVDDRKGYYYCFGCHAKGNAITFLRETENMGFMDAVEALAREVGMQMPARDPQAAEKASQADRLAKITDAALAHYRLQLKTQAGADARAYLNSRGLGDAMLDRFEIGFAPQTRQGVFQALIDKGFDAADIIATGLASTPDDGGPPYDAFRNRIIYPIRDHRGRCIGFGGRAMDQNARAKYLNSRETPLFDKGRALYNHGPARQAAGKGAPLIVAEGYMDVIALTSAGFEAALAPLGTAITADQLQLLWRISDEPIIMLDGDQAGTRAALRLIDLALPMLQGGKTLRFALLPQGQDPDDLIRSQGAPAIAAQLNAAKPLVDILWMRETEGHVFDTPERRAALDARLRQAVLQIQDKSLRHHYGQALAEKRRALFRPVVSQARRWQKGGFGAPQGPLAETRATALAAGQMAGHDLRIALIVASLYRYPEFLPQFEAQLERLWPDNVHYRQLIDLLLDHAPQDEKTARDVAQSQGIAQYLDAIHSIGYVKITPFLRGPKDPDKAQICLEEEFSKLAAATIRQTELRETTEDFAHHDDVPPELSNRLQQAVNMIRQAAKPAQSAQSDRTEDTSALSQNLHALIEAQIWVKKTKR